MQKRRIKNAIFRKKIIPNMKITITASLESEVVNIYKFKCIIRNTETEKLIAKSIISLLWPNE